MVTFSWVLGLTSSFTSNLCITKGMLIKQSQLMLYCHIIYVILQVNCRSPVEAKSTNTFLDGPVNRVHPGARIHLLPTVCRDRRYRSYWNSISHNDRMSQQFTRPPERQLKGHLQSAVTHWLARFLQVPRFPLETRKENRIRLGTHLNQSNDSQTDRCLVLISSVTYEEKSITSLLGLGYSCECCGTETTWGECFAA